MSNDSVEKEQSPESPDSNSGSGQMKGDDTQHTSGQSDDDITVKKPMPRPEDYDFFLNVRRREQNENNENDEPTEH